MEREWTNEQCIKGGLPHILIGPFLNTLFQIKINVFTFFKIIWVANTWSPWNMFNITWQTFSTDIFGFHPDILSIISFTFSVSGCNLAGPGKKKWMHQPAKLIVYFEFWSFIFLKITDSCSSQNSKEHTYHESLSTRIFRRWYYTNFPPFVCLAILTFKYFIDF